MKDQTVAYFWMVYIVIVLWLFNADLEAMEALAKEEA